MWVVVVIAAIILIWIIGNYVRFRGAEGIRRAMRISYKKHFDRHRSDVQRGLKGWDMEALERGLNVERERLQQEAGKFVEKIDKCTDSDELEELGRAIEESDAYKYHPEMITEKYEEKACDLGLSNLPFLQREHKKEHIKSSRARNTSHETGLFGALGTRNRATTPDSQIWVWVELTPFLYMEEQESLEALVEYAVYREIPLVDAEEKVKLRFLKNALNRAVKKIISETDESMTSLGMSHWKRYVWVSLLDDDLQERIARILTEEQKKNLFRYGIL